jgi:hypothetical protein
MECIVPHQQIPVPISEFQLAHHTSIFYEYVLRVQTRPY